MNQYKINLNRSEITSNEINNGKNFNRLYGKYSKDSNAFYRKTWFKKTALPLAALLALVLIFLNPFSKGNNSPFINPPIPGVNIKYSSSLIDASEGGNIVMTSGSKIFIPTDAFTDAEGNNVTGKVKINLREFRNTTDVFLAGIPMDYDTNGQNFRFESAGMIEITADKNGKAINLKKNKKIKVELAALSSNPDFNIYYLDTNQRRWVFEGRDSIAPPEFTYDQTPDSLMDYTALLADIKPSKPRKADKKKFHLSIDFLNDQFPELRGYKNVVFEVTENSRNFNPEWKKTLWYDVKIRRAKVAGEYAITFTNNNKTAEVIAVPVILEENYDQAMRDFDIRFQQYEDRLAERVEAEKQKAEAEKKKAALKNRGLVVYAMNSTVGRSFDLDKLGYWNIDLKQQYPNAIIVKATFTDKKGNALNIRNVNLGIKNKNIYYPFTKEQFKEFAFDPKNENMIWAVTEDLHVAVLRYNEFKNFKPKSGTINYEMDLSATELKSAQEIKDFLGI